VQLKEGMRIVLQANIDPNAGLVNGSQGTIVDFEPFDEKKLPTKGDRYFEEQIGIFSRQNKCQPWPVVRFDNGLTKTIFADCTTNELGNEEPYSLLSRTQIPLMAGYAVTVHKSQV
jgi:ATP-dependent DNA helicase PIF1